MANGGGLGPGRLPIQDAVSDPFDQSRVPSPRAAGIAYPQPIGVDNSSPMRRERSNGSRELDPKVLEGQVAPPSQIERYPIISGRNVTLDLVSSRFRLCLTGYRQLYCDLLDELIERDPHCYAVVAKRAAQIANAKYKFVAPELPEEKARTAAGGKKRTRFGTKSKTISPRQEKADDIAEQCQQDFVRIPRLKQHLQTLAWADYYALQGTEMMWGDKSRDSNKRWRPTGMVFIHSRRISFPDPWNWDLYIWDQGAVLGSPMGDVRLPPGIFGWRVADYQGKFVIHAPQLRADYPTREGLGRELAYWMVLKHIAMRAAPEYLERFSNPPTDITYKTGKEDGLHRFASPEDIQDALTAIRSGNMRGWLHPDSLAWELKSPDGVGGRAKVTFLEWGRYCDDQMTKAVLGATLGTDAATSGSRALGDSQRKETLGIFQLSAECLADSLDSSYTRTWSDLNYPDDEELWPHLTASLEDDPDPTVIADRAVKLATGGVPVDADAVAEMVGIPTVDRDDEEARVMRPVKPDLPTALPLAPMAGGNTPEAAEERAQQEAEAQQAQADQSRQHAVEDGAVAHERGLEVADVGHEHALELQKQGAKLKPQPAAPAKPPPGKPPVKASDRVFTFAERNAYFVQALKDYRSLGLDPDVDALAREYGVPLPKKATQ